MGAAMTYVVIEWCLQAHLSTENYKDAMNGLSRVRRFRQFTFWVRYPGSLLVMAVNNIAATLKLRESGKRKTLIWTWESKHRTPSISSADTSV